MAEIDYHIKQARTMMGYLVDRLYTAQDDFKMYALNGPGGFHEMKCETERIIAETHEIRCETEFIIRRLNEIKNEAEHVLAELRRMKYYAVNDNCYKNK